MAGDTQCRYSPVKYVNIEQFTQIHINNFSNLPEMATEAGQEAVPASLVALQLYLPLSETWEFLIHSTATLLLKEMSYFSELWISLLSLYQVIVMG